MDIHRYVLLLPCSDLLLEQSCNSVDGNTTNISVRRLAREKEVYSVQVSVIRKSVVFRRNTCG